MTISKEATRKLRNKTRIPIIGYDTTRSTATSEEIKETVSAAIEAGYRLFYCSPDHTNQQAVGEVLSEKFEANEIKREDVFIVSKFYWNLVDSATYVEDTLKTSLRELNLSYVDMLLFHCPAMTDLTKFNYKNTWKGMEKCVYNKLAKGIGVSNFNEKKFSHLLKVAKLKPLVNEVECHVLFNRKNLRKYCKKKKIVVMATNPFGPLSNLPYELQYSGRVSPEKISLSRSPTLRVIAAKYRKTNSQIALRYLLQHNIIPLPKSTSRINIFAYIDVFDFKCTDFEMKAIDDIDDGTYEPFRPIYNYYEDEYALL